MILKEGVDWSLDFYLGQVCVGTNVAYVKEGKKSPLKSVVDDPLNGRFDSKMPRILKSGKIKLQKNA